LFQQSAWLLGETARSGPTISAWLYLQGGGVNGIEHGQPRLFDRAIAYSMAKPASGSRRSAAVRQQFSV